MSITLIFGMTRTPARIGPMDITGTDGEVLWASSDNSTYLRFRNDPLGGSRGRAEDDDEHGERKSAQLRESGLHG